MLFIAIISTGVLITVILNWITSDTDQTWDAIKVVFTFLSIPVIFVGSKIREIYETSQKNKWDKKKEGEQYKEFLQREMDEVTRDSDFNSFLKNNVKKNTRG
jgi:hypothetical protein